MFTSDQTGRPASPQPDSQKAICGSCAVCKTALKSSTEPKLLPCLHTVCHACLTKTRKNESAHECPLCTQSFCLLEVSDCILFEDESESKEETKCSACDETEVSGWCVQCEEALCLDCVSAHRRVKMTRDHEVKPKKPPTGWMPRRRCSSHKQESLRFFCLVCEELTCKDCQLITHRGHSFVQQEEAVGSQKERLVSLLESIRKQKEAVGTTMLLLEARLNDIKEMKSHASKTLAHVVHSVYQSLILSAKQIFKEVQAMCAEEVNSLLQRKACLNMMEDCQDYITAFIDKILSTEGHRLLVHKKMIETQVTKLLSQMTCPPQAMFELQLQLKKDHYENIMKCEFMRVQKIPVPFTLSVGSTLANQGSSLPSEKTNSNSAPTATDVHPVAASSNSDQPTEDVSAQYKLAQSNSASSNCDSNVPHLNPAPPVYSPSCSVRGKPAAPEIQSSKRRKTWTLHYYPDVSNQTPLQKHSVPTKTFAAVFPKRILTNNHTLGISHPIPTNNQTPVFQHPLPVISTDTRTPVLAQPIPANNQTHVLTLPHLVNNQMPALPQPILVQSQPPILTVPIPAIETNSQTHILSHPVSNIPTDTQTLILAHPIQANILGAVHTFAGQHNIALTVPPTINTLSVNEVTAVYSDSCPGGSSTLKNSQLHDTSSSNPTSPAINTTPSTDGAFMFPANLKNSSTNLRANLPVKALADSACDQVASVSSTDCTDTDNTENNLPTSTMSETHPEDPSPAPEKGPAHTDVPSKDLLSTTTTTTEKHSPGLSSHCLGSSPEDIQTQDDHSSGEKHWSVGMPMSFRQLVEGKDKPACLKDNVNDTSQLDSIGSLTSEKTTTHDKTVQSDFNTEEPKEEKEESAVTLKHRQQFKRFLHVNLVRLPVSLPPCGQTLPQFHLIHDADHIFVRETQGGKIKKVWRWNEDPVASTDSQSVSQDSVSSPSSDVQFCTVCQSAGATLLCSKCGCAFHSDCHIPPIFVKSCEEWVCLLCLNVNDEIIVYGSQQKHSLNLQDQRKCEKLLLNLLCDENKHLLYSIKRSKTAEFDIILGRLLGKRKPPYRTAAELVSDVWTLFDILSTNTEKRDEVVKLRKTFQQQLNESFGMSLHASLLRCPSSKSLGNISDTLSQSEKHKNTLKRMREFFTTKCGTEAKKPCSDGVKDKEDCGNSAPAEH